MVAHSGRHIAQSENLHREAGFELVKKWSHGAFRPRGLSMGEDSDTTHYVRVLGGLPAQGD